MSKKAKRLIIGLIVLVVLELGFAFGFFEFFGPQRNAHSTMPDDGVMVLVQDNNGDLTLSWPAGFHQDRYLVQFLQNGNVIWEKWTQEEQLVLPLLPQSEDLTIRIQTARGYRVPFSSEERIRMGTGSLTAEVTLQDPAIGDLVATADPQAGTVSFTFTMTPQTHCQMYLLENSGAQTLLDTLDQGEITLSLDDDSLFPILNADNTVTFAFKPYRAYPGLIYYGAEFEQISFVLEELLSHNLAIECTVLNDRVFRFTWAEANCDYYQVQRYHEGSSSWKTVQRVEVDQPRTYTTDTLPRFSEYRYRVVAVGGQVVAGSKFSAISAAKTVSTHTSPVGCTIWPIKSLTVYTDTSKSQKLGVAPAIQAYCVLALEDGMFRIRFGDGYGYIDSDYCLINLPELLEDDCLYNIANSSASLFMAHDFEIPTVTNTVIVGYENVQMVNGEQLVPLLYPTAKRLEKAAYTAIEQGYKLKIYDAYRPQEATIALYNQAINLSTQPIPSETFTGKIWDDLPAAPDGASALTYGQLMTDFGRYTMNYFLAAGKSQHNRGIAMDLTLVDIATGDELTMQTSMHDLSWYSELSRNNANSKTLASIMESAGFSGLTSEWWHFNDLETLNRLQPAHQRAGVSPECWIENEFGLRYRQDTGALYVNCTVEISGVSYTFDQYGYLAQ